MKALYSRSPAVWYGFLGCGLILLFSGIGRCIQNGGFYLNWHVNLAVGGKYEQMFNPCNGIDVIGQSDTSSVAPNFSKEEVPDIQDEEFRTGLNELKDIVNQAHIDGKHLRAMGSRWTVTELPYTEDYLIDTHGLNYAKIEIDHDDHVTDSYKGERKELLVFAQSGVFVKGLYFALFQKGLTLSSTMATDGQTLAGAISTGSHDSAIHFGSIQEHVKGIHLVIPGETVYLQRSSDPVLTADYAIDTLGADRLINSDDMFNAALVSFGSFGVVHGYLLETEKMFKLKVEARDFPLSQAEDALYSLEPQEISNLGFTLDDTSVHPYFMQAYINPYRLTSKGVTVRVLQKVPMSDEELQLVRDIGATYTPTYYGRDLGLVMADVVSQRMLEFVTQFAYGPAGKAIRRLFYGFTSAQTINMLMRFAGREGTGFPMELFGDPNAIGQFTAVPISTNTMEVCCPLYDLGKILPLILKELDDVPAPTSIDVRYTASSNATLAPSKWRPYTSAWISLSSLDSLAARASYERIYGMLSESENIEFTYHWGKGLPRNAEWAEKSFGDDLEKWKTQRKALLKTPEARYVFSSAFTDLLGITTE